MESNKITLNYFNRDNWTGKQLELCNTICNGLKQSTNLLANFIVLNPILRNKSETIRMIIDPTVVWHMCGGGGISGVSRSRSCSPHSDTARLILRELLPPVCPCSLCVDTCIQTLPRCTDNTDHQWHVPHQPPANQWNRCFMASDMIDAKWKIKSNQTK